MSHLIIYNNNNSHLGSKIQFCFYPSRLVWTVLNHVSFHFKLTDKLKSDTSKKVVPLPVVAVNIFAR